MDGFLQSESSLKALVESFEAGTLPISDRRHSTNLAICVWYIFNDNFPLTRLRHAISHYCEARGGVNGIDSGYHETLTRFWLLMTNNHIQLLSSNSVLECARSVVAKYGAEKNMHRKFYGDFDVARSREARLVWIYPHEFGC